MMQRDTRQLLRTGLAIFLTGAVAALLDWKWSTSAQGWYGDSVKLKLTSSI